MEEERIKSGDLVRLKSGGPTMTVIREDITKDGKVVMGVMLCMWFNGAGIQQIEEINRSALKIAAY